MLAAGGAAAAAAAADQVAEWEMANHEQSIRNSENRRSCVVIERTPATCRPRRAGAPIIRIPGDHAFRLAAKDGAPIAVVPCAERMSEPENTL